MSDGQRQLTSEWYRSALVVFAIAAVASVFTAAPAPAAAQNGGGLEAEDSDDEDVPEGPLGDQLEDYWSVDRDVDVIKDRLFEREGRVAVGIHVGLMSSEPFFWYLPGGLRVDYYFTNNWGIELEGSYMDLPGITRHQTDLTSFVESQQGPGFDAKSDTLDQFKWRAHALAVWHPLYGKLALLQRKLSHFDVNLAAGLGAVSVSRPNETRQQVEEVIKPELAFGGGVQFYATENIVLRLTGRGYVYEGPRNYKNTNTGQRVVSSSIEGVDEQNIKELNFFQRLELPTEFQLGVSYMF